MRLVFLVLLAVIVGSILGVMFAFYLNTTAEWSIDAESPKTVAESRHVPLQPSEATEDSPRLLVDNPNFNFGILQRHQSGQHSFVVRNAGKSPLTLKLGYKSCSCTEVIIPNPQLEPDQDGVITLTWENEQGLGGTYRQGASIMTNDPTQPEIALNITGVYSAPIIVNPQPILMQGVMAGMPSSRTFRLYGFETNPLEIQGADWNDKEHFKIEFTKSELTDEEKESRIYKDTKAVYNGKVTVEPGLPFGHFRETFELLSNSAADPHFKISLEGQMIGNLQFISADYNKEQGVLVMGKTTRGVAVQKSLMIKFTPPGGVSPHFEIESVRPDWIKATLGDIIGEGGSQLITLTVEIVKEASLGTFLGPEPEQYGEIMLRTNLSGLENIRIPVSFVVEGGI